MIDFYKNKFEREQKRRSDLDSSINLPILVLTLIMGLNSYIIKEYIFNQHWGFLDWIVIIFICLSVILILLSSYFIFWTSNNLFFGFDYPNFDLMSKYREIEKYNKTCEQDKVMDVEEIIKDKIVSYADEYTIINDKRGNNLYWSRTFIIINFLITIINLIIITSVKIL